MSILKIIDNDTAVLAMHNAVSDAVGNLLTKCFYCVSSLERLNESGLRWKED